MISAASVGSSTVTRNVDPTPLPCTTCAAAIDVDADDDCEGGHQLRDYSFHNASDLALTLSTATVSNCDLDCDRTYFFSQCPALICGFTLYFSIVHSSFGSPSSEVSILCGSMMPSTFL